MSKEDNKRIVRRYLEEVVSGGRQPLMAALVSADVVFSSPYTPEPVCGLAAFEGMIAGLRAAFPDLHIEERSLIAERDLVASRWVATGTHSGAPFAGSPASGRRFAIAGMSFYRLAGGKIVEGWVSDDNLGMLQQLGVLPVAAMSA